MTAPSLQRLYELCWHPVATLEEIESAAPRPLAVRLLGRELAVTVSDGAVMAVTDRCPHRSTRLSVGTAEDGAIRCAYHGWRFAPDGRCTDVPSVPELSIPTRARVDAFDATVAYGLVWVRIDGTAGTTVPPCPAFEDDTMRILVGTPYTWPTSAARRVENFVDLAHFPWVHDGTLGRRDRPVPPVPEVHREDGELRFAFDPPELDAAAEALYGPQRYRMPMPLTVDIDFTLATGARRRLWMTATPIDDTSCRSFWFVSRDDEVDGHNLAAIDSAHLAFQQIVLDEDERVVCNQVPPEIPLEAGIEVSVRTDRVSIEYRRWLRELADIAERDPDALVPTLQLGTDRAEPVTVPGGS